MAAFLNDNAHLHLDVAVQSIGGVAPITAGDPGIAHWRGVATALEAYGANPQLFNTIDGHYAYFGGSQLEKTQDVDSSSAVVIDPAATPPKHETGTLSGRMTMRNDGYFMPALANPTDTFNLPLYNMVFRPSTPWPYTAAAGEPHAEAYARTLAYITSKLPDLQSYYPDLRLGLYGRRHPQLQRQQGRPLYPGLPRRRSHVLGGCESIAAADPVYGIHARRVLHP